MKQVEWDNLALGDGIKRANSGDVYTVIRVQGGIVAAVRLLSRAVDDIGNSATIVETIELRVNSEEWLSNNAVPKVVLSGGFIVRRADGTEEYEACPAPNSPAPNRLVQ